jgi:SAM-dependent methyltransferase
MNSSIKYYHTTDLHNTGAASKVLPYLFDIVKPASIIDIGCGTGSWLNVAKSLGVKEIIGVDGIRLDNTMLRIENSEFVQQDLSQLFNLDRKFDLALCLEVAEHLPKNCDESLVDSITSHSDIVLFSAAIPGQGGQHHVNEQYPQYWKEKFDRRGYQAYDILREVFWNDLEVNWWYSQNMVVYAKVSKSYLFQVDNVKFVRTLVHPELFKSKVYLADTLTNVVQEYVNKPRLVPSLRLVFKSLFN